MPRLDVTTRCHTCRKWQAQTAQSPGVRGSVQLLVEPGGFEPVSVCGLCWAFLANVSESVLSRPYDLACAGHCRTVFSTFFRQSAQDFAMSTLLKTASPRTFAVRSRL